jgi:thioredoxin-dependent peroxiredoxin
VQGQALRDKADQFAAFDCRVFGASFDTPGDNRAFREAQEFPFELLSDVNRSAAKAYDVLRPEDHQYANYPRRCSFLIDPSRIIMRAYDVDDVGEHADEVLRDLSELTALT